MNNNWLLHNIRAVAVNALATENPLVAEHALKAIITDINAVIADACNLEPVFAAMTAYDELIEPNASLDVRYRAMSNALSAARKGRL